MNIANAKKMTSDLVTLASSEGPIDANTAGIVVESREIAPEAADSQQEQWCQKHLSKNDGTAITRGLAADNKNHCCEGKGARVGRKNMVVSH
jgi:hypothetical protein